MYTSEELMQRVENTLTALANEKKTRPELYAPIQYILSLGGKRLRPTLLLMAYNLYRDDVDRAMMPAVALEMYHNFTLMHDDVMDRADFRRGKPCVHKRWDERVAILSGDAMFLFSYKRLAMCEPSKLADMLALFNQTAFEVFEGQHDDLAFETRNDVSEAEYVEMIRLKTSVLLACALKMGAMLADASLDDMQHLYDFGQNIGLAFQLQDDYLDVYGDFRTFGKRIGGDILCNKKTFMLINALQKSSDAQRRELQSWLDATDYVPEEKIAAVTRLYTAVGVDKMALKRIDEYYAAALECLRRVSVAEERKQLLWQFAKSLLGRKS